MELQWISISINNIRPIVVVNVYRPPQGDVKKVCKIISESFECTNFKDNTEFYVMGDFNVDYRDMKSAAFRELDFTMRAIGLSQLVKDPTRIAFRNNVSSNTILDLIFTNSDIINNCQTLNLNLSDHLAVCVTRKKTWVKQTKVEFKGRTYKNYVKEDFQQLLDDHDWTQFYQLDDPNILWHYLHTTMLRYINPMCPIKSYRVSEAREPWMTNEMLESIKDKDRLLRKAKNSGQKADWDEARRARNRVGRDLELLRADFLKNQQEMHKAEPKKFWKTVANIFPGKKSSQGGINLKDETSEDYIERAKTADTLNEFFTGIGPKLAKKHSTPWSFFGNCSDIEMEGIQTDIEEVIELCKNIETFKSSGLDDVSSRICKDAFMVVAEQLTYIFNVSLEKGIFPNAWKAAKVVPLFKGGSREAKGNYRPVSLLPLPGKILEKIVHGRISDFLETNTFLTKNQGGFRKGFSTVSTIADLTDDLFHDLNEGKTTVAAFIDLQKAFDTVDFDILLHKLDRAGIRSIILSGVKIT